MCWPAASWSKSYSRLREGAPPPTISAIPFVVLVVDIAVNFWRARALHRAARETKSQALAADALHFASDVLGSIAVIIGLALIGLGFWLGRCRCSDRGRRHDRAVGLAPGALHRRNPARPRPRRRGGEGHGRDQSRARRGRRRAAARPHGRRRPISSTPSQKCRAPIRSTASRRSSARRRTRSARHSATPT